MVRDAWRHASGTHGNFAIAAVVALFAAVVAAFGVTLADFAAVATPGPAPAHAVTVSLLLFQVLDDGQ